jgi:hypothetical protein
MSKMKLLIENWRVFVSENNEINEGWEEEAGRQDQEDERVQSREKMKSGKVTWRQLSKALEIAKASKEGKINREKQVQLAKDLGSDVMDLAASFVPFVGTIAATKNIAMRVAGLYKTYAQEPDDTTKGNPVLDTFNLDDGLQKLVDDGLEKEFMEKMFKDVETQISTNPDAPIPDIDIMIKKFINDKNLFGKTGYSVEEPE